jgi:endonuclease G, mitochondrial
MDLSWLNRDKDLRDELLRRKPHATKRLVERSEQEGVGVAVEGLSGEEAIVLTQGRPVYLVQKDTFQLGQDQTDTWRSRLEAARASLNTVIPSIGRVNVSGHPSLDWLGTAWVIKDRIVATNRHVAREFAARGADGKFVFLPSPALGQSMSARIDFRQEYQQPAGPEIRVSRVLYIAPDDGPDVGLLELETAAGKAIALAGSVEVNSQVVTIGYPARDSRNPAGPMERIFGSIYDVKRLAPGQVTDAQETVLQHDCTTLGGNSGSAVISMKTGTALGLHFGGKPLTSNYAVPASLISGLLQRLSA